MTTTVPDRRPDVAILSPLQRKPGRTQGGLETVVTNVANALADQGVEVDVLVMPPRGADPTPPGLDIRIRVVSLGTAHKLPGFFALLRYLRRTAPRSLLAAGHRSNMLAARAKARLANPPRIVLSVHNTMSQLLGEQGGLKGWWRARTIRHWYPRCEAVVAVSAGVADDLVRDFGLPREQVHVIHNPVVTDILLAQGEETVQHPWLDDASTPLVLAVGRLRRQKDYPTLIRAFSRLVRNRPARLLILGEGKERPRLEALVAELGLEDKVSLPGFVANPYPYMRQADLYVLSSAWEGFGNVLVEALAMGAPVVATDCPSGPGEILEDGRYGRLCPVGDDQALAGAMQAALETPRERQQHPQAVKRFTVEHAAAAYRYLLIGA